MNKNLVKWALIFGGGFLAFLLVKPKSQSSNSSTPSSTDNTTAKSFDETSSNTKASKEDAEIVATAYISAMNAGEPQSGLTELNKECMKDYGMRCYMDKDNKVVVCDVSGNIILSK